MNNQQTLENAKTAFELGLITRGDYTALRLAITLDPRGKKNVAPLNKSNSQALRTSESVEPVTAAG